MKSKYLYKTLFIFTTNNPLDEETFELKVDFYREQMLSYEDIKREAYYLASKEVFPKEYSHLSKIKSFELLSQRVITEEN